MDVRKLTTLMLLLLAVIVVVINAHPNRTPGSKALNLRSVSDNNSPEDKSVEDLVFLPAGQNINLSAEDQMQLLLNNPVNYNTDDNDVKIAEHSLRVPTAYSKRYYGPHAKIWTGAQCKDIIGLQSGKSLSKCMNLCDTTPGCTALSFNGKSQCFMRKCTSPVPQPLADVSGWVGYSRPPSRVTRYFGPIANIWSDNQCNNIGNHHGKSLTECMDICDTTSGCTAMNFKEGSCVMRACAFPLPMPEEELYTSWVGYGKVHVRINKLSK